MPKGDPILSLMINLNPSAVTNQQAMVPARGAAAMGRLPVPDLPEMSL